MLNELNIGLQKSYGVTNFTLKQIPLKISLAYSQGGVIASFETIKSTLSYQGGLSEGKFKQYKKELSTLFKDFDDIFGELNRKYYLSIEVSEMKSRYNKQTDFTEYDFSNTPITVDISYESGGVILIFDTSNKMQVYEGAINERDFRKYSKEMSNLLKDFDDIFGEVNKKFKLTLD